MIALIFIGDLLYCPYLKKYEDILAANRVEYEVLYWNRSGFGANAGNGKYIAFEMRSELKKSPVSKLKDFLAFGSWLRGMVARRRYEKLILLSTLSGILIADVMLRKYPGRYIYDIRDYSYERIKPYYLLEKKIIENARYTVVSSKGFQSFLPENEKYVFTHNMSIVDLDRERRFIKKDTGKLNFVWMGAVRYFDHQKKIMEKLDRDGRFQIIFHGVGPGLGEFQNFAEQRGLKNVFFTGKYKNEDRARLLEDADLINNSYAMNYETRYAVSNKFYDGVMFHIPQLVECGSYKEQILREYPVGLALDAEEEDFAERLFQYYRNIEEEEFDRLCDELSDKFRAEEIEYMETVKQFALE